MQTAEAGSRVKAERTTVLEHLKSCERCQARVESREEQMTRFAVLEAQPSQPQTRECPPGHVWFEVAAGIPREDLDFVIQHAAQCDHCGPHLRNAIADLSDQISEEEALKAASVESATPEWRTTLAGRLRGMGVAEPAPPRGTRTRPGWSLSSMVRLTASAAVVLLLIGGGWVAWHRSETHSASRLIAQAYVEKRTIEMRIEGAPWAPLRRERGSSVEEDRMARPALLKAEGEIAEHLKSAPDDVTWLEASGRASLLEEGGEEQALAVLDRAHELAPNNRSVDVDLASAYVLRGQIADRPQDFGTAVDLLAKTLSAEPANEAAQFNYAIALEKLGLKKQSVAAWQKFLQLHPSSTWDDEARNRLQEVEEQIREHDQRSDAPLKPVEELAAAFSENRTEEIEQIDGRLEEYLAIAVQQWLPEWADGQTPRSRTVLRAVLFGLAGLAGERHGDRWLAEMLEANKDTPAVREAFHQLASSEEGIEASASHAGGEARRARALFQQAGILPGVARSQIDLAMVYQLQHDRPACEAAAAEAAGESARPEWPWLEVQSRLEEAVCANSADAKDVSLEHAALEIAQSHRYPILASRAENFEAASWLASGDTNRAWSTSSAALQQFWKGSYPELRGYNLLTKFHDLAEMEQQWSLEVAVLEEAVPMIASHPNIAMRAFEQTRLGEAQLETGEIQDAELAFRGAERMFDATPAGARRSALMAEAEVGLAKAELQGGRFGDAERRLNSVRPALTELGDEDLRRSFYRTSGIAELRSGNLSSARDDLRAGVQLAEDGLQISGTEAARWEWRRRNEPTYRALVELELRSDPAEALRWWEWFKGANLRRARATMTSGQANAPEMQPAALRLPDEGGADLAILSYAVFGDRIAAWVWDSKGIRQVWIEAPASELNARIQGLSAHCSDAASSRQTIRAEASELYKLLVRPVEPAIAGHERLIIEPDGALRGVPFELLVDAAGDHLGDRFAVSISPGIEYLDKSRQWTGVTAMSTAAVVGNGETSGWGPLPETDQEARAVAGMFRGAHLLLSSGTSSSRVPAETGRAEVFHFSGHAFSDVRSSGLVMGNGELLDALRLPEWALHSRLAVLSACDTARGSNGQFDDEDSLVLRLMEAGVPEVVASRWMVDSPATLVLMRSFYRELLAGKSVSLALALASRELRSRPEYSHPFYWAGFSVFGRG